MIFSTTLLSTLKAQYKIDVANIGEMKLRFTPTIHEHALHFLNSNYHNYQQPATASSDNYVRIDSSAIRHLNLHTKIDVLKLNTTADFFAQLVFVSKVIIHEINEILAKVSGFDQCHIGTTTKHTRLSSSSSAAAAAAATVPNTRINSTDTENEDEDEPEKDQQTTTLFTYEIDISMKGFEVIGQTPSNTIVKFENDPPTKLTITDNLTSSGLTTQQSIPTLDKTTISACSCGAIRSLDSFEGFCFRFGENFQLTNKNWKPARSLSSPNIIISACCVPTTQYLIYLRAKHTLNSPTPKWFLNVQWNMKGIDINLDSIISKRFTQLTRTITSTHLIEPTDHLNNNNNSSSYLNLLSTQDTSTKTIDESEDDERIKRLEYEHLIL
ncbi:unnamed protein product [Adineta steineri]|uniref:Bridge-like lipid transfer protein family member 1 C-terminal domain-containing protein n=1 Tax=Adineta steineri TaxID=433720 RepID=A0A815I3J4_9BILA|nr:unnamed protein product [Adineta steineri]